MCLLVLKCRRKSELFLHLSFLSCWCQNSLLSLLCVWSNWHYFSVFCSENQSWCCWTCSRCLQDRRAGWPSTSPRPPTTGSSTPAATWAYVSMWRQRRVGAPQNLHNLHNPLLIGVMYLLGDFHLNYLKWFVLKHSTELLPALLTELYSYICILSQTAPCLQAGLDW